MKYLLYDQQNLKLAKHMGLLLKKIKIPDICNNPYELRLNGLDAFTRTLRCETKKSRAFFSN